jgi:CHAT domain-containing protein
LADYGVALRTDLQTKAEVLALVQEGKTQLLHVASHARFNADHPDASPLLLYDDDLLPDEIDYRLIGRWRTARPVVFFNACEAGRIEYKLTGLGGWAEKFINDVRATAFVGTLWQVNDALAAEFAKIFYDELLAGQTLGAACFRARLHIKELAPANPTWLAYTLYGDPNTVVAWG